MPQELLYIFYGSITAPAKSCACSPSVMRTKAVMAA